jgi:hypothetical protein
MAGLDDTSVPMMEATLDKRGLGETTPPPLATIDRPITPARKSKQEFVFELWALLSHKLQPMLQHISDSDEEEEEKDSALDFGTLAVFLRDPSVMECMSRFWAVLTSFVRSRRLQKGKMRAEMKESREILTSLLIVLFPSDTLDVSNLSDLAEEPLSEAVYTSAKDVIDEVFCYSPQDATKVSKLRCDNAAKTIEDFLSVFESWKQQDATKVLASLKNYYEEWVRSKQVLQSSSMNELQRSGVLETVEASIANARLKMARLVGSEKADQICAEIDDQITSEPAHVHSPTTAAAAVSRGAPTPSPTPADSFVVIDDDDRPKDGPETTAEKLRKYGIPAKIKSGITTPSTSLASAASVDSSLMVDGADGPRVIDLSEIAKEEGSKKYWEDFAAEIAVGKFHRLFELLSELRSRLKVASPDKDAEYLDDLIDVAFLKQSIEHGTLDAVGFYGIFDALWTQMNRLHAPAFDAQWKEWHDAVVDDMSKPDASWQHLLPNVLNKLLCKLDEIEDAIRAIRSLLKPTSKHQTD